MRVIIFGVFHEKRLTVERLLEDKTHIVGYSDKNPALENVKLYEHKKFYQPEELPGVDFDAIILCCAEQAQSERILEYLKSLGIPGEKILPTWWLRLMESGFDSTYDDFFRVKRDFDGAIFGTSYARREIKTGLMKGRWYKFAMNGMDLRGHELYIRHLKEEPKFQKLKYVVLDLPYFFFNWDISSSAQMPFRMAIYDQFDEWGHYLETHSMESITQFRTLKQLIGRKYETCRASVSNDFGSSKIVRTPCEELSGGAWKVLHEKTIEENKQYFFNIVKMINELNIRFYVVSFPYAKEVIKHNEEALEKMKKLYYDTLEEGKAYGNFKVIDMMNNPRLKITDKCYYNPTHVNEYGSVRVTEFLNNSIFHIKKEVKSGLRYSACQMRVAWESWVSDGETAGYDPLWEGLRSIRMKDIQEDDPLDLSYSVYIQDYGWSETASNGEAAAAIQDGKKVVLKKPMTAIRINLNDPEQAKTKEIAYSVFTVEDGWTEWVKNGEIAGDMQRPISSFRARLADRV